MHDAYNNTVKRRLSIISILVVVTSILGILSILEVARGVRFHESNIQHLSLTAQLKDELHELKSFTKNDMQDIRGLLKEIRLEPSNCLKTLNPVLLTGLKILGTDGVKNICEEDIAQLDKADALLLQYDQSRIGRYQLVEQMKPIVATLHGHSFSFRPLIAKTVNSLLLFTAFLIILKGLAVSIITLYSSRSIVRQFNKVLGMENQLKTKNDQLNLSINQLELQKHELEIANQTAEHNALHDVLTALPNRRYLETSLSGCMLEGEELAVFHIGLDGFKQINDTKGHQAGDKVLCEVTGRLKSLAGAQHFVARIGGDEFVVIYRLGNSTSFCDDIENFAQQLVNELGMPVSYHGFDCRVSVSVGIAIHNRFKGMYEDYSSMLINADIALYRAKIGGGNCYAFYDEELHARIASKKELADQIQAALTRREFVPYFQPQFDAKTLEISGVEALVRWMHPQRGIVFPDEFLALAEDMGVIAEIDGQVFEDAIICMENWQAIGIELPKLSVNVSYKRLTDPGLIDQVRIHSSMAGKLAFEILETVLVDSANSETRHALDALTDLGVELELDDFGSGHASILALLEVKPKRFKIDRQLISNMHESKTQQALVNSIIDIGKSLELEVVAEGVETAEHVDMLRNMGCSSLQGYYFSRPLSNDAFIEFVKRQEWRTVA